MKSAEVVALVLAAGSSTRMWPLGDKHRLTFGGLKLIDLHLAALSEAGIERFVLVANDENASQLRDAAAAVRGESTVIVQSDAGGMAGAVLAGIEAFGEGWSGRALYVTQPHDVVDARLHQQMLAAEAGGLFGYLAVTERERFPGGYVTVNGDRAVGLVEKPALGSEPSKLVTIVAHLFRDAGILADALRRELAGAPDDAYERAVDSLMRECEFGVVRYDGTWHALKYPWHALDVTAELLRRLLCGDLRLDARYTEREPGVFIGENTRVLPGAHLVAPCVVGHGVIIGNNALVRESIIGDGCVVGYNSEVARSYLGERCFLHANYVGDSVLEQDVLLGFGTISANFRLDQQPVKSMVRGELIDTGRTKLGMIIGRGARVGVGVNVMPGVKIRREAVVLPGQVVERDILHGTER
jgi:bifunctional UDP-N-acetylglucosamine pyrophosphorylase/glucosamine-1-phosphate N-acetyltransferase